MPHSAPDAGSATARRRRVLIRAAVWAVVLGALAWLAVRLGAQVDWSAVRAALGHLAWWNAPVLAALLLARQLLTSAPVARFVTGLGQRRAFHNEVAANLVATVAPPPADMVLRVGMFRSWGVDTVQGLAGVTLATVVFWGARFLAPALGLIVIAARGISRGEWLVGGACAVVAAVILGALALVARSPRWAALVGRAAALAARRVGRDADPESWADAVTVFRERVAAQLRSQLAPALALMLAGIIAEGALLLASLRFVGVADTLSAVEILGMFLLAYPVTILPFLGIGVLDTLLVATWLTDQPAVPEATLVAGMIVWRTVSLGGTLAIGALSLGWWRWTMRARRPHDA